MIRIIRELRISGYGFTWSNIRIILSVITRFVISGVERESFSEQVRNELADSRMEGYFGMGADEVMPEIFAAYKQTSTNQQLIDKLQVTYDRLAKLLPGLKLPISKCRRWRARQCVSGGHRTRESSIYRFFGRRGVGLVVLKSLCGETGEEVPK